MISANGSPQSLYATRHSVFRFFRHLHPHFHWPSLRSACPPARAKARGYPKSHHCQLIAYTLGVRCLPEGSMSTWFPVDSYHPALVPFWLECISSFHSLAHLRQLTACTCVRHSIRPASLRSRRRQTLHPTMELIGGKSPHGSFPVPKDFSAFSGKLHTRYGKTVPRMFP